MRLCVPFMPIAAAMSLAAQVAHAEPPKAAVFSFQLANLGAQGPTTPTSRALAVSATCCVLRLKDTGRDAIASTAPVKADVAEADLRACGGCAGDFARALGADVAITGEIQKVSNLIGNINVCVKDLRSEAPERAYSVDIRGDDDASFDHGVRHHVKNKPPSPGHEADATAGARR